MITTKECPPTLKRSQLNPLDQTTHIKSVRIVIVDANTIFRQQLDHALSKISYLDVVGVANDGYRGVEVVARLMPDLVIMDMGMPLLDGVAATQKIKAAFPEIRSIILSARTAEKEIIAALSGGADAYCIKGDHGDNIDNLLTAIASVQDGATYLDAQIAQKVLEHLKPAKPAQSNSFGQLSQRELEVLRLIVEGYSNPQIGATLYLSTNTVKTYVRGIMNKLVVNDRVQAAVVALRHGII
ncbi:two component transcriptional regulator, LuxR family [Thalassoporum mexicanum PCC 7367]|uniref:LuxR C-terminal-related transcriptional regulator n=1 Tax=Thalassoporum mexicanum TaxID=3457544 RepID=UPI00029FD0F2|nr:response regulator transcription factor [Pseudanabaena sp. PCC 7367]AFY70781.1 two component transcriptional regulator, LuxR family [Pseudanabaena sp. PCC 7367]